jgi:transcriptional regulator with XRE-family HTH domain
MNRTFIKHRLVDKGLTLADLARRAELSYDRIVRIVHGYRKPMAEEVERIALILEVSPSDLLADPLGVSAQVETR